MSFLSSLFGQGSKVNFPAVPTYQTDPNFTSTQNFLNQYSQNMLNGNIPDYYKSIGQTADQNGQQGLMNDYISQSTSDIINNDLSAGALTGRGRTGLSSNALNTAGNISGQLRYQDYANAQAGKQSLLSLGLGTQGDVRDAAFGNQNAQNSFDQWNYGANLANEQERAANANAGFANGLNSIGNIISGGGTGLTNAVSRVFGGGNVYGSQNQNPTYQSGSAMYGGSGNSGSQNSGSFLNNLFNSILSGSGSSSSPSSSVDYSGLGGTYTGDLSSLLGTSSDMSSELGSLGTGNEVGSGQGVSGVGSSLMSLLSLVA